jgi:alpha-D-ribose 1-methylphosphonate 5-triphosphate diphosphatase
VSCGESWPATLAAMARKLFTNARVVSPDEVFLGTVELLAGRIVRIEIGATDLPGAEDLAGDYLLPGLVDLGGAVAVDADTRSTTIASVVDRDARAAVCGITTLVDAYDLDTREKSGLSADSSIARAWLEDARAAGILRCDHGIRWHLRPGDARRTHSAFFEDRHTRLVSFDFADWARLAAPLREARRLGIALAATNVRSDADRLACAERCVGLLWHPAPAAAVTATAHGGPAVSCAASAVVDGAPTMPDVLDSGGDPLALLHSVFVRRDRDGLSLPDAARAVAMRPARLAGLADRGTIALGQRADFVRVREVGGVAVPLATWRGGERVA